MAAQKAIRKGDLLPLEVYGRERAERRQRLLPVKRARRVAVGPDATFYFENYETMFQQIHEMLFIEKGGEAQIEDELSAYNPLIPQGQELIATLMFEVEDPVRRAALLAKLTHVEQKVFLEIGRERIAALSESEVERTKEDGKTSSIHFLRFSLTGGQIAAFRDPSVRVLLGIDHPNYAHFAAIQGETRAALAADFD